MAKISLIDLLGGSIAQINSNFTLIRNALNNRVLWRDNPAGEPNQMLTTLDMDNHRILNLPAPASDHEPVRRIDVATSVGDTAAAVAAAQASAASAASAQQAVVTGAASIAQFFTNTGSSLVGFIQSGVGAFGRTTQDKLRERVSCDDYFLAGEVDHTLMIQRALDSGSKRVVGNGKTYTVTSLKLPSGVVFDGEGGQLLTNGNTSQDVVVTNGTGATLANWTIKSNTANTRKGRYGVLVAHSSTKLFNLAFWDISYTAVFNDADNTNGDGIFGQNCGWDVISNYTNARNSTFRNVKGIGNGRSLFSTDAGARACVLDGFESIDNGLDVITTEHKDVLHFEFATDCTCKNGVIRYTPQYTGGTISQTWAMMRWNASTNCHVENVEFKIETSVNGRLLLGLIDKGGTTGNTACSAKGIRVNSDAVPSHKLTFLSYDGDARFRIIGGHWRGYVGVESQTAGANAFEQITDIDAAGPGSANTSLILSQYATYDWTIARIKCRGYAVPFSLNGFQDSSVRDGEVEGASTSVFRLLSVGGYTPNGGIIAGMILRGSTGIVIETHDQTTRSLLFTNNRIDGSAVLGLDTQGSNCSVKALGNLIGSALTTIQSGTNTAGVLNANMNNVAT